MDTIEVDGTRFLSAAGKGTSLFFAGLRENSSGYKSHLQLKEAIMEVQSDEEGVEGDVREEKDPSVGRPSATRGDSIGRELKTAPKHAKNDGERS
jgi:hypothetical protein